MKKKIMTIVASFMLVLFAGIAVGCGTGVHNMSISLNGLGSFTGNTNDRTYTYELRKDQENVDFSISVSANKAKGTYTVKLDGSTEGTVTIDDHNRAGTVNFDDMEAGEYNITITYEKADGVDFEYSQNEVKIKVVIKAAAEEAEE